MPVTVPPDVAAPEPEAGLEDDSDMLKAMPYVAWYCCRVCHWAEAAHCQLLHTYTEHEDCSVIGVNTTGTRSLVV